MSMMAEFRKFAVKGNVMDLAVGVIIGAAFGKIVDSFVSDIVMPVIGAIFGGFDFSSFYIRLAAAPPNVANTYVELKKAGVPLLAYGNFITIVINFMILAFIVFLIVRAMNRMREKEDAKPVPPPEEVVLLRDIRDSLKAAR